MMKTGAVSDPRSRLKWDIFLSSQETEATVSRIVSMKRSSRHISGYGLVTWNARNLWRLWRIR
ncbi:hypothetical protein F2Q70_00020772 [Brassica cretica]|uniref:Uncharacterized protein n=1 Tax=Brassica cretica TaxID=69181 RepID=A0A8S9GPG9_BRACR|nr:hypothetical protein F2Q70_00020772 [Brassica cretica]KAF3610230.1 hypothetical protein DY000_02046656 [Brassica cretica]